MSNVATFDYARLGQMYHACSQAGVTLSALSTTATGLILVNPYGSGKNIAVMKINYAPSTAPAGASVVGVAMSPAVSATQVTLTTPLTVQKALLDGQSNGAVGKACSAATTVGTPIKLAGFLGGFAQHGNKIYIVGQEENSQPNVFVLEDFKMRGLGTEAVRRHLASITSTFSTILMGTLVSMQGHDFYVLDTGTYTYALELESGMWSRWAFRSDTSFPIKFAINVFTSAAYKTLVISSIDLDTILRFDPTLFQDVAVNFTCSIITDKIRFDTFRNKTMGSLTIWANKTTSSATMLVQWTDNDYQSYSTGISLDLSKERPKIYRLGRFRERAFKFTFTQNHPLLLQAVEVDINMGQA